MKILLTGGSGMVGKNILEHPLAQQHKVLSPGSAELNLLNQSSVSEYIQQHKPDLIIHSAGRVGGIQANIKNPVNFLVENTLMGIHLVTAARAAGIPRLLNLGSSCMYPKEGQNPLREETILTGTLEPTNEGYAIAKCAIGRLCEYVHREEPKFEYKTLVPCNLYGRWDKFDPKNSHLVPAIILKTYQAKTKDESKIEIWGDGSARREFMYAGDLADFIFFALEKFEAVPQYLNVGLGHDYSVLDYYKATSKALEHKAEFTFDLTKPVGMKQKLVDISQLQKMGWTSKTSLENGILKSFDFFINETNFSRSL